MAKAPPSKVARPAPVHTAVNIPLMFEDVPYDIIRHFDKEPIMLDDIERKTMRGIYEFMPDKEMGEILGRIREIEGRIGSKFAADSCRKVYHYLRLTKDADDLLNERDSLRK